VNCGKKSKNVKFKEKNMTSLVFYERPNSTDHDYRVELGLRRGETPNTSRLFGTYYRSENIRRPLRFCEKPSPCLMN
jgi:hypothetical protein